VRCVPTQMADRMLWILEEDEAKVEGPLLEIMPVAFMTGDLCSFQCGMTRRFTS
jgi:hypothetical protein